jgi:hypothetical protein
MYPPIEMGGIIAPPRPLFFVKGFVHVGDPRSRAVDGKDQKGDGGKGQLGNGLEDPQAKKGVQDAGEPQGPRGQQHLGDAFPLHLGQDPQGLRGKIHLPTPRPKPQDIPPVRGEVEPFPSCLGLRQASGDGEPP